MRFLEVAAIALLSVSASAQTMVTGRDGHVFSTVVVDGSDAAERHAAEDLASYLGRITGGRIPIVEIGPETNEAQVAARGPGSSEIVVGRRAISICPDISKLSEEEFILRSTARGLVVAGGSGRGTLYAVYHLLGDLGVRWWTPWAETVPSKPGLVIPKIDVRDGPALEYRAPSWRSTFNPLWAVRNGDNFDSGDASTGGHVEYAGFVHTYYPLVPPDPNFKLHPEWFSLINGKRTDQDAQLCTTNPELRAFVLEQVKKELRAHPQATIVSVSQNDCFNPCQCDGCRALVKKHGSESALTLDLANYVADGIRSEFPKVAVDTLAYQWSRHAPTGMRPRPNVIVRLCSIECDFGHPFDSDQNRGFRDDILAWCKLTNRLYVWDYFTNFANYVQPMPDEATIGPNVSFLAAHGVKGIFGEGDYTSNGGAMSELKAWLLAQMLWNPKADDRALTREFLDGYYGPAGKPIAQYLQLLEEAVKKSGQPVPEAQDTNAAFLIYPVMKQADELWQEAEGSVLDQPQFLWRVRQSHQSIHFVFLQRWDEFRKASEAAGDQWPLASTRARAAAEWLKIVTEPGPAGWTPVTAINEGGTTPREYAGSLGAL